MDREADKHRCHMGATGVCPPPSVGTPCGGPSCTRRHAVEGDGGRETDCSRGEGREPCVPSMIALMCFANWVCVVGKHALVPVGIRCPEFDRALISSVKVDRHSELAGSVSALSLAKLFLHPLMH